jgi:hypothetical protein
MSLRDARIGPTSPADADIASASLQEKLLRIDWSFSQRERAPAIEAIHPYPAKFIGEIPRALLQMLPLPPGTLVLDPFAGCGTTLVEAQRRGVTSVGIDLNPIACLIARVKTSPAPSRLLESTRRISRLARENKSAAQWIIPNVDHWFKPQVQCAVSGLLEAINRVRDVCLRDALRLALSSILVRVSNQESDTRYAAIEKPVKKEDVFTAFEAAAEKLHKALESRDWPLTPANVIEANTLTLSASAIRGRVGLVITSPPSPNAYEYWLYHKYRMWWLGFDPLRVKEQEIGARAHFFKTNHHTEEHFWEQMRQTFSLIDHVLIPGGYACFVIGRSRIHGRIIDNADIIQSVAASRGFATADRFERTISANRKSFNLSHANIKTETVLVLQKENG